MISLRRTCRQVVALMLLGWGVTAIAESPPTSWPQQRPIRWIVPFPPGASADAISRVVAQKLSEKIGQSVIVESRGGASGQIAHDLVATSRPDGHTVLFVVPGIITNQYYMKNAVNAFKDLLPVIQLDNAPMVLLSRSAFKPTSLVQVLEAVRAKPDSVSCAAAGSLPQIGCELLRKYAQADLLMVPFRGQAQASNSVIAGDVDLMFDVIGSAISWINTNRLHAIAVTSEQRAASLPNVPAANESVPGFKLVTWHGVMVPSGTPPVIVAKMNAALNEVLKEPQVRERLEALKLEVAGGSVEAFAALMKRDNATYKALLEAAGVKPE